MKAIRLDELRAAQSEAIEWGAVHAAVGVEYDEVPPHAFRVTDYAVKYGVSRSTAQSRLRHAASEGKLQSGSSLSDGKITRFYWLPKKGAQNANPVQRRVQPGEHGRRSARLDGPVARVSRAAKKAGRK